MAQPADEDGPPRAYLPKPPPFYEHFTVDNLARLEKLKAEASAPKDNGEAAASSSWLSPAQVLSLPPELRYLIPPAPPSPDAEYHVFGRKEKLHGEDLFAQNVEWIGRQLWNAETDTGLLKDWTYEKLYPSSSSGDDLAGTATDSHAASSITARQTYLFRLLRSIVLAFIEVCGILATNPAGAPPADASDKQDGQEGGETFKDAKLKQILTMVLNMHALINEYRPHQARETLLRLMEGQLERKRAEIEGVKRMSARITEVLEGFGKASLDGDKVNGSGMAAAGGEHERRRGDEMVDVKADAQRQAWILLHQLDGP